MKVTTPADSSFQRIFRPLLFVSVVMHLPALFAPLMEPDAALYAGIAKEMALRNDWINLFADGRDWLDKPHLPFWITALSFKAFGINTVAYKLPGILCWLLGSLYTFRLARHFYGKTVAQLAALIYLTALHAIISNNDLRAEPYLTFFLIAAVYYLVKAHNHWRYIIPAALFSASALMTKGPFVLLPIGGGVILHWMLKGDWKQFVNWRWYVFVLLTAIFTLPEIICLYLQFDQHPEKLVFGRQDVSGIQFFLWESQFGRFMNTGPIKGKGDPFFFIHTMLWAFLPWSILLYAAIIGHIKRLVGRKIRTAGNSEISTSLRAKSAKFRDYAPEFICFGSGILTLLLFSFSRFQLPHYVNILFPFFSVITAFYLYKNLGDARCLRNIHITQTVIAILMIMLPAAIAYLFPVNGWIVFLVISGLVLLLLLLTLFSSNRNRNLQSAPDTSLSASTTVSNRAFLAISQPIMAAAVVSIFINIFFYPTLLTFQSGSEAAMIVNKEFRGERVWFYDVNSYAFEFYADAPVQRVHRAWSGAGLPVPDFAAIAGGDEALIYTSARGKRWLDSAGYKYNISLPFYGFKVTRLDSELLRSSTRASRLDTTWVLKVVRE
ncbi:MAG TPA: glycosyltransferase family 39 protein [Parasegetibacter sp.]